MIGYWNGYETYGNMGGWGPIGFLAMIVFWALVIALIVMLIKRLANNENILPNNTHRNSALELLKERYAKGEIDTKEYEERKKVLLRK
ncbi:MAG TPA: SHOCT domain-containing protein [Candidatus Kaiserbacteria bacterium]|nr:SHOCT domain-containing protein [Candidatus Kaiserbacteria bacterium]